MITAWMTEAEPDVLAMNTDWQQALGIPSSSSREAELRDRMSMECARKDARDTHQRNRRQRRPGSIRAEKSGGAVEAA